MRTINLNNATLTMEQTSSLPSDGLSAQKQGNIALAIDRPAANRAVYTLK